MVALRRCHGRHATLAHESLISIWLIERLVIVYCSDIIFRVLSAEVFGHAKLIIFQFISYEHMLMLLVRREGTSFAKIVQLRHNLILLLINVSSLFLFDNSIRVCAYNFTF